jgi:hypothetical protein
MTLPKFGCAFLLLTFGAIAGRRPLSEAAAMGNHPEEKCDAS